MFPKEKKSLNLGGLLHSLLAAVHHNLHCSSVRHLHVGVWLRAQLALLGDILARLLQFGAQSHHLRHVLGPHAIGIQESPVETFLLLQKKDFY